MQIHKFGASFICPKLNVFLYLLRNNVVLYRPKHLSNKFEPDFVVYDGEESVSALDAWITSN